MTQPLEFDKAEFDYLETHEDREPAFSVIDALLMIFIAAGGAMTLVVGTLLLVDQVTR